MAALFRIAAASWLLPSAYARRIGVFPSSSAPRQAATSLSARISLGGKRNTGKPNVVSVSRTFARGVCAGAAVAESRRLKSPV
jgi:hypothetical protein